MLLTVLLFMIHTTIEYSEVVIPTEGSFTQFVTADDNGDVWFVEQRGAKIGKVSISSVPGQTTILQESSTFEIKYVEIVAPLVSAGIIAHCIILCKKCQRQTQN